jgi:hypothetical protein
MNTQQEACSAEGQLCKSLKSDPNRFAALSSRRHVVVTTLSTAVAALDANFWVQGRRNRADATDVAASATPESGPACARRGKDPANGAGIRPLAGSARRGAMRSSAFINLQPRGDFRGRGHSPLSAALAP